MRLSSFTDFSLRVLIYVAIKDNERSTVSEIAKKYNISKNHLVKVVHNLSNLELIKSYKGRGGGISLAVSPDKILIGELIKKLEEESYLVECFNPEGNCVIKPSCLLKKALKDAKTQFYATLNKYSLENLAHNKSKISKLLEI